VNFNNGGSVVAADAPSRGTTTSAASNKVQFANVNDLVVGMTVTGTNIAPATTITAINRTTNTVTLSANPTLGGADTLSFSVVPRTLTLTGTNAGNNTLGNSLANSTGGGVLSVVKDGSGTWVLSAANTYTGATNVNAGTLKSAQSLRSTSGIAIADGARWR
jgi:fibronectin-binding autotransporter adhesin